MSPAFTESVVEDAALVWLEAAGWRVAHGPEIAPETLTAEARTSARSYCVPGCATHWPA